MQAIQYPGGSVSRRRTMRAMLWVGGIGLLIAALIGAGRLWATDRDKEAAKSPTRIALFNLSYVIQKSDNYKDMQAELKESVEPFQRRESALRRQGEKLRAELEQLLKEANTGGPISEEIAQKKEELERKGRGLQREIEDNQTEAKLKLGKKTEAAMKEMYVVVSEAVARFAREHDYEIILHYNDAITAQDYSSLPNIQRKLSSGALTPLTSKPGTDISKDLVELLNLGPREKN
jgi:Skp family chaperone for outer membrane proteins